MKLPIPADWDGESWCRWAICWPDSEGWEAILRGFVTLPQRGWTWDERTGSILAVQETGREITAQNLPFSGVFMACNDTELVAAFSDIALAIRYLADKQCCDNLQIDVQGGFQGTITQGSGEVVPIYGSEPPIGLPPGEIPPTYDDPAVYDADKCRLANQIIDGLTGTLTKMAAFGTFNAVTLAILIGISIPTSIVFPPAMIPTAISVLIILTGSLFLIAQLNAAILADRDNWVCWLYEGENTQQIIGYLADAIDIILAAIPVAGTIAWALKALVLVLVNSNTLNQLFSGAPVAPGGSTDCSGCDDANLFMAMFNGPTKCEQLSPTSFRAVERTDVPGRWEVVFAINHNPADDTTFTAWVGPEASINLTVTAGSVQFVDPPSPFRYFNQSGAGVGGGSGPTNPTCCGWVIVVSSTTFDLSVEDLGAC